MSDAESLTMTVPFSRGCKARSSLPIGRSSSQARESVGVLYLQYGDETKQIRMPVEINSEDTLRALFVTAFPQQLTMKKLQSPNMAIYIKDTRRNVYFDLEDIRNITSHSCLKVYHKDPSHVFNRHTRPTSTEGRLSKEALYGSHSPVHRLSSSSRGALQSLQGSMSPPMVRSMPSSPSRMAYSGRNTQGLVGVLDAGSTTLPRDRLSSTGRSSSLCTSSSAILERRDVKPDEDGGSCKNMALMLHGEGGPHYPDSYCSSLQDGGRSSFASSQCSGSLSHAGEMVDAGVAGIPAGLQQYRASVKPLMGYGDITEYQMDSLHRQKSRKFGESQLPQLATPPPSPHRLNEVRMNEGQIIGGVGLVSPERMSPIRRSLRRENNGATVGVINRSRGSGSSSSTSSVFMDNPLGQPEMLIQGHMTAFEAQSERMKAMEAQIASLAGLVHHALSVGGDLPSDKGPVSGSTGKSHPAPPEPQATSTVDDVISSAFLALQAPTTDNEVQQHLLQVKSSVSELRLQLNQLRHLQISQQQTMKSMLRMAGQELVVLLCDRLVQSEERTCGQRAEMEEERIQYLATEEKILKHLSELEDYVNHLQKNTVSLPGQLPITLKDVEEGAMNLRSVGETLAILKGEFPELQVKMRSVLRLEIDAVRFLKEEPHKMDCMLKRVKALTEALSSLRRCVSESTSPSKGTQVEPLPTQSPQSSPQPQPRSSVRSPQPIPSSALSQPELNNAASASPATARRVKTTQVTVIQAHQHSPPLNFTHGRDLPTVAKVHGLHFEVSPRSREGSPALQKRPTPLQSDELHGSSMPQTSQENHTTNQVKTSLKTTARPIENTERESPEGSLSQEASSVSQPSTHKKKQPSIATKNLNQVLQEAKAILMNSIPDLNVSDAKVGHSDLASGDINPHTEMAKPLDTPQDLLSGTQHQKPARQNDEVKPPASHATVELPSSASPAASPGPKRGTRPQMEKPRRSSVEKKQSPDRSGQSPPVVPRRSHAATVGLTTERTGEVISTTMKESGGEQGVSEKEPSVIPQPKPLRQPPEVKPKPKPSGTTQAIASENMDDKEDDNIRVLKELQVTLETSSDDKWLVENSLVEGQQMISSKSGQKHILSICTTSAPHLQPTNGCLDSMAVPQEVNESRKGPMPPDWKMMLKKGTITNLNSGNSPNVTSQYIDRQKMEGITSPDNEQKENTTEYSKQQLLNSTQDTKTQSDEVKLQLSGDKEQFPEEEGGSLSPDIVDDGGPPPPPPPSGKIAQQISKIRVKCKTQDMDKMKGSDRKEKALCYENQGFEENDSCDTLNEPLDLESDFKRLSTIFEFEEDVDPIVSPEGIVEEDEIDDTKNMSEESKVLDVKDILDHDQHSQHNQHTENSFDKNQDKTKPELLQNAETNRKFNLPKIKLSGFTQAIRSGSSKTRKKNLEAEVHKEDIVIFEQDPIKAPKKLNKESSRFTNHSTKRHQNKGDKGALIQISSLPVDVKLISNGKSIADGKDLCKKACHPIGNLEEAIKLLEITMDSIKTPPSPPPKSIDRAHLSDEVKQLREGTPSKRPASQILKNSNSPQSKRVKAQPPPNCVKSSTKKQTTTSCTQQTHTRLHHSSGSPEKTTKVQKEASPKQPSQQSIPR
ncbi:SRC kinase signaling inhibitor 1-like isoform X1 [Syngnathus typhle]|uniref:SRC kinase signaling inhibitor 1-like isoform X1 n=1 Tax=Syngnathus typhle TaxID=161592 RepID=UPI002A6B2C0F|nr:SRC kinase signaling inhibitor 1-like isoform X1 [Syngnathus typhle]XP_061151198.1 SRC kinase signaling inhibitor 1-like isoform X1 [Syngnathus typhle]